jgi:hypothetical protein
MPHIEFSLKDRERLRRFAEQVAELAARPVEAKKRDLWYRHNALEATRPVIFCDPENSWHEIIPDSTLTCESPLARKWEYLLRKDIFWGSQMCDDRVVPPYFTIEHVHSEPDWGLKEDVIGGKNGGSYVWDAPIKTEEDIEKLHTPHIDIDFETTEFQTELARDVFSGILDVQVKTAWWWSLAETRVLARLRGLKQMMLDYADRPEWVHRVMTILHDGILAMMDDIESRGLLSLNNGGDYVGSGGFGWTHDLPKPGFDGTVHLSDLWGFVESQETVGVSPKMFAEYIFPYQLPILARFGLTCYGCCEPVDKRWKWISQIPNLRRVSVSPWSDRARMAEYLADRYIFSLKPNPALLAMESFDPELVRAELRRDLEISRGCRVEVIMKDNHTIRNDPRRVVEWVRIAHEEAQRIA